jgi:hypothetical protein
MPALILPTRTSANRVKPEVIALSCQSFNDLPFCFLRTAIIDRLDPANLLWIPTTNNTQTNTHSYQTAGGEAMSMKAQIEARRLSAYSPTDSTPIRLASATIQAVDQLGAAAADEIERTADQVMCSAAEVATKLRELAGAIHHHSEIANEHVAKFCSKATSIFESAVELQQRLRAKGYAATAEVAHDESLEVPGFMRKGPADFDNEQP